MISSIKNNSQYINSLVIGLPHINRFLQVSEAVIMANELLHSPVFYNCIAAHPAFDMSDTSPQHIAGLMCETQIKMSVDLYYASDSNMNIDGYDDNNTPSFIHLNIWRVNRSPASICNSLIHACVHAVNEYNKGYDFGHGDSPAAGKENTAPYWIGALAQRMVSKGEPIFLPLEHDRAAPLSSQPIRNADAVNAFSDSMWLAC